MAGRWRFELLGGVTSDASSWTVLTDLGQAQSRRVSFQLNGTTTVGFSISGRDPEAVYIEELLTDVRAVRNDTALARARVVGTQDSITATAHTVSVNCADYREVLKRRLLLDGDPELTAWASPAAPVDQAAIAWALISRTQSRTGGNLGITNGAVPTSVLRNRTYEAGASIGELLQNLSQVIDGFEWDIDPALEFQLYYPQRGLDTSYLLDLGGSVRGLTRAVTSGPYANVVRMNGASGSSPVLKEAAIGLEGRWEAQVGDTNISEADTIDERADYELASRQVIRPSYNIQLNTDLWSGPEDLWLGDTARLIVKQGRLDVDTRVRVLGVDFDIDADGYESVSMTVGNLTPNQRWYDQQQELGRRLSALERR